MFLRPPGQRALPTLLTDNETHLAGDEQTRTERLLAQIGLNEKKRLVHLEDFGWEVNLIPRDAKSVLAIGCGNGIELIFLRAVLPEAHITAIDYQNKLLPGLHDAVNVRFMAGDLSRLLPELGQEYDLIFSNHTMEHLYEPDVMLKTLAGLLVAGGHIVSILPMVGLEGTPFLEEVHRFVNERGADGRGAIHPLELVYFDPGHPWKTNPDDICGTLSRCGFTDVRIYQRENHRSRPLPLRPAQFRWRRGLMTMLNRIFIGIPRHIAMRMFPRRVPAKLPTLFYAAERRLPFGTNHIMSIFCEEALFIARVER